MNEIYTDIEQGYSNRDLNSINELEIFESLKKANRRDILDRINDIFQYISSNLGINHKMGGIEIKINCYKGDIKKISDELYKTAKSPVIVAGTMPLDENTRITNIQTPLGRLNLIENE